MQWYDFIPLFEGDVFLEENRYEQYEAIRRKTDELYGSVTSCFDLSKGSMMVIWTMFDFGRPCTQKEICKDWLGNKQTINSAVKKLIEEGIIDIAPSPDNFREKLLSFTEKGKFLALRTAGKLVQADKNAFERLSEEEQNEALRISQKHYEFLKEEFDQIKGEAR